MQHSSVPRRKMWPPVDGQLGAGHADLAQADGQRAFVLVRLIVDGRCHLHGHAVERRVKLVPIQGVFIQRHDDIDMAADGREIEFGQAAQRREVKVRLGRTQAVGGLLCCR